MERIRRIVLLAAFLATLGLGLALGTHVTLKNIARLDLLKPTQLSKPSFPWALSLGWRLLWAPTPEHLTPEHLRKADEANSLLGFDPGVIGPLSGIKKYNWQAHKDIPQAQKALREAFVARLGRKLDYVDATSI